MKQNMQQATVAHQVVEEPLLRLHNFPISFFAIVMGMAGCTIAFQRAESILHLPFSISIYLLFTTITIFVVLLGVYTFKLIKFPSVVSKEMHHPIKMAFFPTTSISLLLLSIATMKLSPEASKYLWIVGSAAHFLFTVYIMSVWIQHTSFEIHHFNPAWFIPIVGNIIVPVAGVDHFPVEVSWFFFSIGLVYWILLFALFFNRVIFHKPLPDRLLPTLFILIAPPAVGFISYVKIMEMEVKDFGIDPFAKVLYYSALFLFLLLASQFQMFSRIKFYLSWWAYSFPIAAMTIASTLMFHKTEMVFFNYLVFGLLSLLSVVIVVLIIRTGLAIKNHEICVED